MNLTFNQSASRGYFWALTIWLFQWLLLPRSAVKRRSRQHPHRFAATQQMAREQAAVRIVEEKGRQARKEDQATKASQADFSSE